VAIPNIKDIAQNKIVATIIHFILKQDLISEILEIHANTRKKPKATKDTRQDTTL
jgi:hypothetical protein